MHFSCINQYFERYNFINSFFLSFLKYEKIESVRKTSKKGNEKKRKRKQIQRLFTRRSATLYTLPWSVTRIRRIQFRIGFQNAHLSQPRANIRGCTHVYTVDTGRGWSSAFPAGEVNTAVGVGREGQWSQSKYWWKSKKF